MTSSKDWSGAHALAERVIAQAAAEGVRLRLGPDTPLIPDERLSRAFARPVHATGWTWAVVDELMSALRDIGASWVNLRFSLTAEGETIVRFEAKPDGEPLPSGRLPDCRGGLDAPSLPSAALAVIERAGRLALDEIEILEEADRSGADTRLVLWDLLRDRLAMPPSRTLRFMARQQSWAAVNRSLRAVGWTAVTDDGYWRVSPQPGFGVARAARFAACVLVAPQRLEPEVSEGLLVPWRRLG